MTVHVFVVAEDDEALVKHIGKSFRFSAVEVCFSCFYAHLSSSVMSNCSFLIL